MNDAIFKYSPNSHFLFLLACFFSYKRYPTFSQLFRIILFLQRKENQNKKTFPPRFYLQSYESTAVAISSRRLHFLFSQLPPRFNILYVYLCTCIIIFYSWCCDDDCCWKKEEKWKSFHPSPLEATSERSSLSVTRWLSSLSTKRKKLQ